MRLLCGKLIRAKDSFENMTVDICDGKIVSVRPMEPADEREEDVVDARDGIVAPGFIDTHNQGCCGYHVWQDSTEALSAMTENLVQFGVTSILATTYYRESTIRTIVKACEKGTRGAEILGLHVEGPFVSPKRLGAIPPDAYLDPTTEAFQRFLDLCNGWLRIMTIAPELPHTDNMIRKVCEVGAVAEIGHSDSSYDDAKRAFDMGVTRATHLFNAMRPFHHREPGTAGAVLDDNRVTAELIADGFHVHPAGLRLALRQKGAERICLVTDSLPFAGLPEDVIAGMELDGMKVRVEGGVARYEDGTICGSLLTSDQCVRNFCRMTGTSVEDAIRCSSTIPARFCGAADRKGDIVPGMDADIVILDRELNVRKTIKAGEVVFSA